MHTHPLLPLPGFIDRPSPWPHPRPRGAAACRRRWRASWLALLLVSWAAAPAGAARPLQEAVGPYRLQVLVDGRPARTFAHRGETWVLGRLGDRYTLRVENRSDRRVEAVVSVDGRDVIDGRPGDFRSRRGYLVPAGGSVDIDGWRISHAEAAAFRFSSVADSYAGRTGSAREVGVIGVALFRERPAPVVRVPRPLQPRWRLDPYDPPATDDAGGGSGGAGHDRSGAAPAPAPSAESSAPSAELRASPDEPARQKRPGLGTEFGEAVSSAVEEVEFERESPARPAALLGLRYNDRPGLIALGVIVDGPAVLSDSELRRSADPFPGVDRGFAAPPPGWRR